jgi:putative oxidoreductase
MLVEVYMAETNGGSKWKVIGTWVLVGLLGLAFLAGGGMKLAGLEMHQQNFARWGFPGWAMYAVGLTEVVGAILLLIPKTSGLGAAIIGVTMIGAIGTHVMTGEMQTIGAPIVLLILVSLVGYARRDTLLALIGQSGTAKQAG